MGEESLMVTSMRSVRVVAERTRGWERPSVEIQMGDHGPEVEEAAST
jgi:hypothetical protein